MSLPRMIAIPCLQTKSEIRHTREPHPSGSILVQVQISLDSGLRRNDGRKIRLEFRNVGRTNVSFGLRRVFAQNDLNDLNVLNDLNSARPDN
jgi:hypothetical protein